MRHTFECHSSSPSFLYPCGVSGCIQTFTSFSAISSHLQRRHPSDWTQLQDSSTPETGNSSRREDLWSDEDVNDTNIDGEVVATDSHVLAERSTALLLLTLKERHRLTQAAVNFSVGHIKEMVRHVLDDVKESVKEKLREAVQGDQDIDGCFDVDTFRGLDTEHLQTKFYKDHFNLIVS